MLIIIYLRDLKTSPCEMLATARRYFDEDSDDHTQDPTDEDLAPGAFREFLEMVRALLSIPSSEVDVYIEWRGDQGGFKIPSELIILAGEHGWPIEVAIN